MKIEDIIAGIGEDKVRHQNILDSLVGIRSAKIGSRVTFRTDALSPGDVLAPRTVGIVFWFPKEDFDRVIAEDEARKAQANQ